MDLILAEQTLLIALDDEKGRDTTDWGSDPALAAALLLDLARLELVELDGDEKIVATNGPAPEHDLLRDVHAAIRGSDERRSAKAWVKRLARELKPLRDRVARGLVARGVLSEQRSSLLGLVSKLRYPAADDAPERELRERLHAVLRADREPTEEEALLIGLLEPLGLIGALVPRGDRRAARKRAKAVADQGLAGTAVRDAVRAVQASVMSAAIVPTITTN